MSVRKSHVEVDRVSWRAGDEPFVKGLVINYEPDEVRRRAYRPQDVPNLPNALSKVVDERSACDFVRRYGLLGYCELLVPTLLEDEWADFKAGAEVDESREAAIRGEVGRLAGGDPLPWFLAQARSVRFATELLEALQGDSAEEVGAVLARYQTEWRSAALVDTSNASLGFTLALGLEVRNEMYPDVDAPGLAMKIVADLVASNTRSLQTILFPSLPENRLRWLTSTRTLVETVWFHVGDWADHGLVRLCELDTCRTPFLVTDGRQRFCPADDGGAKSRCAGLFRSASNGRPVEGADQEQGQGGLDVRGRLGLRRRREAHPAPTHVPWAPDGSRELPRPHPQRDCDGRVHRPATPQGARLPRTVAFVV